MKWIFECLDARRFLIPTTQLWPHKPSTRTPNLYPEIPPLLLSPASPRLALGLLDSEEWQTIPGIFKTQIPKKARELAKRICESLHGQWLLWNESVSDKEG